MKTMHFRWFFILSLLSFGLAFNVTSILAQCGPSGNEPCKKKTKKTPKKTSKPANPVGVKKKVQAKKKKVAPIKDFDDDYNIPLEDVQSDFHNLAVELNNNPNSRGYVFNFGTTKNIIEREKIINFSIKRTGIDASRIVQFNCGVSDRPKTIMRLVHPGETQPTECGEAIPQTRPETDENFVRQKKSVTPTGSDSPCPSIEVTIFNDIVTPGEIMTFAVNVSGGAMTDLVYDWTISAGEIVEGQATPAISVSTADLKNTTVTATVYIVSPTSRFNCDTVASDSGYVRVIY